MAALKTGTAGWSPDVQEFVPTDVVPDALILQTSTVAGSVEGDAVAVRVPFVDDADAAIVAEGATISESDPDLNEAVVFTVKVAQLVRLSYEQFSQDGTAAELSRSVSRAVTVKANQVYLTQAAPTAPATYPPAGLLNVSGIVPGGAVDGSLDELIDLVAELEGNGATPSAIVCDPVAWARLRKLKTATDSNASLIGAGTNDAQRLLLDLPVLTTPAMTAGSGVVVDKSAIVSAVGQVRVAQSEQAYFSADSMAVRCTWRFGAAVMHPDRIGKFTVTDPDA